MHLLRAMDIRNALFLTPFLAALASFSPACGCGDRFVNFPLRTEFRSAHIHPIQ
jgi:hypothetical protein